MSSTQAWPPEWVRARGAAIGTGVLRRSPQDFRVHELFERPLAGEGEHLYLLTEKVEITTVAAQSLLARAFGVSRVDVSFAGMKDRCAVTRQWFSVRTPLSEPRLAVDGLAILRSCRHRKKLRRGDHAGNRFEIVIREFRGSFREFRDGFGRAHFPNYFGPQRFGRNANNISAALDWARKGQPPTRRFARSLHISTLRSLMFNDLLANRVDAGHWNTPQRGDALVDGVPTGPLWGRGRPPTRGTPRDCEDAVAARHPEAVDALEWVGLRQERRVLGCIPEGVDLNSQGDELQLNFSLPAGTYATSAIREWIDYSETPH